MRVVLLCAALIGPGPTAAHAVAPLERNGYARASTPEEIHAALATLATRPHVRLEVLGSSVRGREIAALVLEPPTISEAAPPLTLMLVGSQHGAAEAAGAETLLALAETLADDPGRDFRYVIVPDANPDGRALRRRANANGVNLNTDYVRLSQPESRALLGAVQRFRPEVLLDVHESAVLKRESLAREGYLTDFDAQFEAANNPALPPGVATLALQTLLPEMVARVAAGGLPAQRYLAEIRSTRQPITNGGLTLRNLRNRAAVGGTASFLLETRLEPRHGAYPTWRNIAARVARQRRCIEAFLGVVRAHAGDLEREIGIARGAAPRGPLLLDARYAPDPDHPRLTITMKRLDGSPLAVEFADHRRVAGDVRVAPASTYLVTGHVAALREALERQGLRGTLSSVPGAADVLALELGDGLAVRETARRVVAVPPGSLYLEIAQPEGRALPLLLDPRSTSSLFREPEFRGLATRGSAFFVYGVFEGVARATAAAR
ncbi:MAG: hypothetical protein HY749_03480 [Gammaproteobacteria bacterium]|nr:hypothetical protein [Gammaproteobacteria bacterium]